MIVFNQLLDLRHDFLRYNRFTPLWPIGLRISGVARNRPVLRMGVIETQLYPVFVARRF